jgi:hypothetical protein
MTDYHQRDFTREELSQIKNNLYTFYRWFVVSNFEENITAPHIKNLAYKLMDLTNGELGKSRIAIAMPPQHSKSSLATVAYASWLLLNNPKKRILVVNAEEGLSITFGSQIRTLLYNAAPFFGLQVSKDSYSKTSMKVTKKGEETSGSIQLTGAEGKITGRPVDYIIVDDPYKGLENEFTPTQIHKKWDWYTSLIEQRLRTKGRSKLVLLHTRWHSEDIQGKIKDDDYQASKYEFVEYPAIDKDGNPLWKEYYDMDFYIDKQKTMGERKFAAIYQQQPLDLTSDFFHVDHLIFEDDFDDYAIARCRSWDIAASDDKLGDQRDYSVGVRMLKTATGQYWIFDYERGQYGNNLKHVIKNTAKRDSENYTILLETGAGTSDLLFQEYKSALPTYTVYQSKTKGATKTDRATPLANAIFDRKVHVCIRNDELRQTLLSEFKAFPNSKHDDCVDAVAHGFNWLKQQGGETVATANKRKRRRVRYDRDLLL